MVKEQEDNEKLKAMQEDLEHDAERQRKRAKRNQDILELSQLKLSLGDIAAQTKVFSHDPACSMVEALAKTMEALKGPDTPKVSHRNMLKDMSVHIPGQLPVGQCLPWFRDVCRYRDGFDHCVISFQPGGPGNPVQYFAFLYACQSPFYAMLLV